MIYRKTKNTLLIERSNRNCINITISAIYCIHNTRVTQQIKHEWNVKNLHIIIHKKGVDISVNKKFRRTGRGIC